MHIRSARVHRASHLTLLPPDGWDAYHGVHDHIEQNEGADTLIRKTRRHDAESNRGWRHLSMYPHHRVAITSEGHIQKIAEWRTGITDEHVARPHDWPPPLVFSTRSSRRRASLRLVNGAALARQWLTAGPTLQTLYRARRVTEAPRFAEDFTNCRRFGRDPPALLVRLAGARPKYRGMVGDLTRWRRAPVPSRAVRSGPTLRGPAPPRPCPTWR
jgi:hypothetical protein